MKLKNIMMRTMVAVTLISFLLTGCGQKTESASTAAPAEQKTSETKKEETKKEEPKKADKELVVVSWGGAIQDAQRTAIFKPFEEKFGVKIKEVSPPDYGKLKAMVAAGKTEWDVMDLDADFVPRGIKENLLEPLDFNIIDKTDLDPMSTNDYSVGAEYYTTGIAYNSEVVKTGSHPKNWAEFWDTSKFPQARTLQKWPVPTLEIALLADGVAPDKLYPLDVDRAFKSLDKIKKNVKAWWATGAQSAQLLTDKETPLGGVWSGRIIAAKKQGAQVEIEVNQSVLLVDSWAVPKGTTRKELAMKFIAFATSPQPQADFAKAYPYGVPNKKAYDLMDEATKATLSTSPEKRPLQVSIDVNWWAENFDKVNERFQKWLIEQ
ncbi:MAG: ABC transporter substrate-binding protein [Clostridia bacterium]|nr:ABC transporter substrate-binding protein [Clostridia bacterium]